MYVIVGLGNPGRKYLNTRHNIGFDAVDVIASKFGIKVKKLRFKALTGEGEIGGENVLLIKPQTFMNLSGESIREAMEYYKIPPERLIVIYDDVALPLGKLRIRPAGSAGGHNGMKNIIYLLESDAFPRIRIGIGEVAGDELHGHVLGKFSKEEVKVLSESVAKLPDAVEALIAKGVDFAMNVYNKSDE